MFISFDCNVLPHWIVHIVNFWNIHILLYVMNVGSCCRGCPVDNCGLRILGRSLGWDLFSTKHSGLILESPFTSSSQLKSQLRKCVNNGHHVQDVYLAWILLARVLAVQLTRNECLQNKCAYTHIYKLLCIIKKLLVKCWLKKKLEESS